MGNPHNHGSKQYPMSNFKDVEAHLEVLDRFREQYDCFVSLQRRLFHEMERYYPGVCSRFLDGLAFTLGDGRLAVYETQPMCLQIARRPQGWAGTVRPFSWETLENEREETDTDTGAVRGRRDVAPAAEDPHTAPERRGDGATGARRVSFGASRES